VLRSRLIETIRECQEQLLEGYMRSSGTNDLSLLAGVGQQSVTEGNSFDDTEDHGSLSALASSSALPQTDFTYPSSSEVPQFPWTLPESFNYNAESGYGSLLQEGQSSDARNGEKERNINSPRSQQEGSWEEIWDSFNKS
jgi:hypothetical protein